MRVLEDFVHGVLGPHRAISDRSWPDGFSRVLEVQDANNATWLVKQHRHRGRYRREVAAYRSWVGAFGSRAPRLRSFDDDLQALVLSSVPGRVVAEVLDMHRDPEALLEVHQQAGALLRRLHDAESFPPQPGYAAEKQAELEYWAARSNGLLDPREIEFARAELRALDSLPTPRRVPCHLDFSPRNWLTSEGRLYVIDFEHTCPEVWVNDLGRLWFGQWHSRPELKKVFLNSYGRTPTKDERALLIRSYALKAVENIIVAHEAGKTAHEASMRDILKRLTNHQYES